MTFCWQTFASEYLFILAIMVALSVYVPRRTAFRETVPPKLNNEIFLVSFMMGLTQR